MPKEIHLWKFKDNGVAKNRIYIVPDAEFSSEEDSAEITFIDIAEGKHVDPVREEELPVLKGDYFRIINGEYHTLWGTLLEEGYIGKAEYDAKLDEFGIYGLRSGIFNLINNRTGVHNRGKGCFEKLMGTVK